VQRVDAWNASEVKSDDDVFPVVGGVARVLPHEHKVRLETAANNETRAIHRTLDVTKKCSLDGGPPNSCLQSFVANDRSLYESNGRIVYSRLNMSTYFLITARFPAFPTPGRGITSATEPSV